ncbi:MAG: branched-chain amino acid ABC transporter permease [Xanthobacteraceae bacterium]|nr:branched-chain amino acid ABC transporter permease [Xanthobacteraceae bacterium]
MSSDLFLQATANALSLSALYGMLGLSFGLIYSTTRVLHFAHGGIYVLASYAFFGAYIAADLPLPVSVIATTICAGLLGVAAMRYFYRPLLERSASQAVVMIASLGLYTAIENVVILVFGSDSRVVSKAAVERGLSFGGVYLAPLQLVMMVTAVAAFAAVYLLLTRTRLGHALRGVAEDSGMAEIVGIDVKRLQDLAFLIGSLLLGIAAVLVSLDVGLSPRAGLNVVLIATVAAITGGATNPFSGAVGGALIGFVQSFGVIWIDPRWQNLLIFGALLAVVLVRPSGLLSNAR